MKKHFSLLTILAIFITTISSVSAQSVYKSYKDGQVYLKLKNEVSITLPAYNGKSTEGYPKAFVAVMKKYGVTSVSLAFRTVKNVDLEHTYMVHFSQINGVDELIKAFQTTGIVDFTERVPLYKTSLTPNDPSYNNQFALPLINGPSAWGLSTGSHTVKVAVVDNAVMINHTDLTANKWVNTGEIAGNGIDDDNNGYVDDVNGYDVADNDNNPAPPTSASTTSFEHGTHCGGIADAVSNNSTGVASIGYGLSLIGVKCEPDNTTNPDQVSYAFYGLEYAMAAHADVVSMSWGGDGSSQTEQTLITQAWNQGIILVAAAGNDGVTTMEYPAAYTHVVAVGSTTNTDAVSSFSNYGTWLGVMAPGSNIYSTLPGTNGASSYGYLSGTSMATPMVAGLCGLMKSYSPASTNAQIVACLKSSCTNIDAQNPSYVGQMGSGRINAYAALQCLTAPPIAAFKGDLPQTCNGILHFTDLSTGSPTSWQWTFGDGGTSTVKNPVHEYFTNGAYTVTLSVTNSQGTNSTTKTNYVTVSKPAAPAATAGSRCGPGTVSLSSSSTNMVRWYATATAVDPLATGNTFVTPSLSDTAIYYVEDSLAGVVSSVGPATKATLGTGGYYSNANSQYLIFNCLNPCTLKSVLVDAQAAGSRTIELRDSANNLLQSIAVTLAAGSNTATLNFVLPVANGLRLGVSGTTANLYRNNAVASGYPFTLAGLVSITGTSGGTGYYYYFYNWQIQAQGCVSLRAPVAANVGLGIFAGLSGTDVTCFGSNNGTLTTSVLGGTPQYTYIWNGGQTSSTLSNVTPGTYTVTITDAAGCSATNTHTISQPATFAATATKTNVTCNGGANGAINLTTTGGTSSYSYNWGSGITSQNRTGLAAGTYSVTVTDAHACTAATSVTITQPTTALTETVTPVNGGCGTSSGSASVAATGGTGNYSYVWNNALTGASVSNLSSGTYSVTVTDGNSCTASASAVVSNSGALTAISTIGAATCYGSANGSVSLAVSGATNPVTYTWSTGSHASSITNVAAGSYTVTVVDGSGCSIVTSHSVTQPNLLSATLNTAAAGCSASNGSATSTVTGGTANYSYVWNNSRTTSSISSIPAGNYSVTVTDSHGCTASAAGIVTSGGSITATMVKTNVTCNGGTNGSILLTVSGATSPVNYAWSNSTTSSFLTGVGAGTFTVTITDGLGCSSIVSQTLTQPAAVSANSSFTTPTCAGLTDGSATVNGEGGNAPYSYTWSNGFSGNVVHNVSAGAYSITITDASNCSSIATLTVTDPTPITASVSSASATCNGSATGTAQLTAAGGSGAYTYQWSDGSNTTAVSGLAAGDYTVTITDSHGCTGTSAATISQPNAVSINTHATPATAGQSNGSAAVTTIYNGVAPYTYAWSNGATDSVANNLSAGTYVVALTDSRGCQATANVTVSETTGINDITSQVAFSIYPNPASSQLFVALAQLNAATTLSLKNVLGQTLFTKSAGAQKTAIDVAPFAGGVYFIEVTQAGNKTVKQFVISK